MKLGPLPIGVFELVIILLVVLVIFGPKNLPKLGTAIGKAVKNIREGVGSTKKAAEKKVEEKKAEKPAPTTEVEQIVEATPVEEEAEVVEKPKPTSQA